MDRSPSNTFHPTAHQQYNNVEIQENYGTTTTNRVKSVYSKPLALLNRTEPQNIHEVPIINKSTTEKPEREKSHKFSVPQYHSYSGEEIQDDETTKSIYAKEPKIKYVSTTDFPQYHSGETTPTDCKYCCSEEKFPCAQCCDVGPNLSEGLLKSSGG
ncbi:uncharacterized protein LOC119678352 [Teleopsis dalmanni]|uniref:uncharacterized protein LOC119678352 n=1 Tax=Teleopsis dalmanni TaxID=139649 RepID=UPI0018CE6CB1|nr:uncharacterized protein LOC119678352 [Teleopsis dalmanni]